MNYQWVWLLIVLSSWTVIGLLLHENDRLYDKQLKRCGPPAESIWDAISGKKEQ